MNMREMAVEYRLTHWAQIMRERKESGLNIKAYCEQQGFHENVYYYWQRKLREAAIKKISAKEHEADTSLAPVGWARLEGTDTPAGGTITIEVNGYRVEVTEGTDPELLAKVCRTLKLL